MAAPVSRLGRYRIMNSPWLRQLCSSQKRIMSSYGKHFYGTEIHDTKSRDIWSRGGSHQMKSLGGRSTRSPPWPQICTYLVGSGLSNMPCTNLRAVHSLSKYGSQVHSKCKKHERKCFNMEDVSSTLPLFNVWPVWGRGYARARRLGVDSWSAKGNTGMIEDTRSQKQQEETAWMLRTNIENAYLSWIRNTYIMTIAGVTVYTQITIPLAEEAAVLLLFAGSVNLATGSLIYMYNMISQRKHMLMSRKVSLTLSSIAGLHIVLWLGAMMLYLGYIEDDILDIEEEIRREEEITKERRKRKRTKREHERYD